MSLNTILATAPLTTTNFILKATGTTIGNSLIFDNGTNVGIGTTSPNEKLDVNGAIQFRADTQGYATTTSVGVVDFYAGLSRMLSFGANGSTYGGFDFYQATQNNGAGRSAMRITSAGNVGIGINPFTNGLSVGLDIAGGAGIFGFNNNLYLSSNSYFSTDWKYKATSGASLIQTGGDGSIQFLNAASGTINTTISFTERMRIGSTGLITVTGSGTSGEAEGIFFKRTSSLNQGGIISGSGGVLALTATNAQSGLYGTTIFQRYSGTTFAESMRINSDGLVIIGTTGVMINESSLGITSSGNTSTIRTTSSGGSCILAWNSATSGNNSFFEFGVDAGFSVKGSITYNRGAGVTMYNTTSDANLKNIIGNSDKQKSIDILNSTKIIEYSWKEDKTNKPQIGVIAQELYETFKGAVTKGSDAELLGTEDYKTWGVDKTAFTFHLIAGWQKHEQMIQEQQALITSLQAQINELKNK